MAANASIRLKLFLLLLAIAIAPMAIVTWHGHVTTQRLGKELAEYGRATRTDSLVKQLRKTVETSAAILRYQKESVELALRVQASEVERRLSLRPKRVQPVYLASQFDGLGEPPPGLHPSPRHLKARTGRKQNDLGF